MSTAATRRDDRVTLIATAGTRLCPYRGPLRSSVEPARLIELGEGWVAPTLRRHRDAPSSLLIGDAEVMVRSIGATSCWGGSSRPGRTRRDRARDALAPSGRAPLTSESRRHQAGRIAIRSKSDTQTRLGAPRGLSGCRASLRLLHDMSGPRRSSTARRARHRGHALPIATPIASTIAPPSVTTTSEERKLTCRNRCRRRRWRTVRSRLRCPRRSARGRRSR